MSKTGIPCYRSGGCGPYEMYSCNECPASKSDYLQRDIKDYPPYLDYPKPRKPQTNYDRLISKTPEEMARLFANDECGYCRIHHFCYANGCKLECADMWLKWLRSPVKDGEE